MEESMGGGRRRFIMTNTAGGLIGRRREGGDWGSSLFSIGETGPVFEGCFFFVL